MSRHPIGIVLTGGRSRRMGADKPFVEVDGRPLAVAVADALWEGGCNPVECQGGDLDRLESLGLAGVPDTTADAGPAAAIADALGRHHGPLVVAACDLPDLDGATVAAVVRAGEAAGRVAVAHADGLDHLLGYWPAAAITGLCDEPRPVSYRDALDRVDALRVPIDPTRLRNVNSPGDL